MTHKDEEIKRKNESIRLKNRLSTYLIIITCLCILITIILYLNYKKIRKTKKSLENQIEKTIILQKQKEETYSLLAHDIKSPLKIQRAMIHEMLRKYGKEHLFLNDLSEMEKGNFHLLLLIDNILSLHNTQFDLQNNFQSDSKLFFENYIQPYVQLFKNAKQQVQVQFEEGITIATNTNFLAIIIRNLLDNALKHSTDNSSILVKFHSSTSNKFQYFEIENEVIENTRLNEYVSYLNSNGIENLKKSKHLSLGAEIIKKYAALADISIEASISLHILSIKLTLKNNP